MVDENDVSPDERSNEELDSLADNDVARNSPERPISEAPAQRESSPAAREDYEFIHNGKPIKATREQILKWAQQGYDYPQKAQKLNQEKTQWDQQRQGWEKNWGVYKEIDDYAKQNKEWWDNVQQAWQTRGQNSQTQNFNPPQNSQNIPAEFQPYLSKIQSLEEKLSKLEPTVSEFIQEKQSLRQKESDTKLDQEIQSIREKHKDLDWNSVDENGKSLETRVLEHAQETGIPSFRAALRDLLHDDLMSRAQAQAKQSVAKGIQSRTKLGVLGESPTSQKGRESNNRNIRNTSYEELEREIRDELKRGVS